MTVLIGAWLRVKESQLVTVNAVTSQLELVSCHWHELLLVSLSSSSLE